MLIKTYNFYGKHANYMNELTKPLGEDKPPFFKTNMDVMYAACIIGFKYNKKSNIDKETEAKKKTIMNEQIYNSRVLIQFLYRLILLLDTSVDYSTEDRLRLAYEKEVSASQEGETPNEEDENFNNPFEKLLYQYMLGGIEYLYENLIGNGKDPITNMGTIIDEISYVVTKSTTIPDIEIE